jgi:zinc/manganese transport system substrate-binding protein
MITSRYDMHRSSLIAASVGFALLLSASTAVGEVNVVASLPDLAALAVEVGGPDIKVTSLSLSSDDPHYVDARPSLLVTLSRADLLIRNGLDLEVGWLPALLTNARNPRILVGQLGHLDASTTVAHRLEVPAGHIDRSHGDIHAGGNPHYTHDPRAALAVAKGIRDRLSQIDPAHASAYAKRFTDFETRVNAFVVKTGAKFAALDPTRRLVVPYHRSWSYLLDWLGLSAPVEIEPKPGVSPSPAHAARVVSVMRKQGIHLILQERYYPGNTGKTIARLTKATHLVVPGQTRHEDGERYLDRMEGLTKAVYDALAK